MIEHLRKLALTAGAVTIALINAQLGIAANSKVVADNIPKSSRLISLAAANFPNLTRAEREMLWFCDAHDVNRGKIAIAGTSPSYEDPSNDPIHAEKWSHERDIRASLLEWLCEDPAVKPFVNPAGIEVLGARIVGSLDLSHLRVPISLTMNKCSIAERIVLVGTEIPHIDLDGSDVSEIDAEGLIVHGNLNMGDGFRASGETRLERAKIDGALICSGGSFHYSKVSMSRWAGNDKPALILDEIVVSELDLDFGFRSEGAIQMRQASVAHDFGMYGAHLSNPHHSTLVCNFSNFGSLWFGLPGTPAWGVFESNGLVDFKAAKIANSIIVANARFIGAPGDDYGFYGPGMTAGGFLYWRDVVLQSGATVDLTGAHVGLVIDEEKSWPEPGKLLIDGLTYDGFSPDSPLDLKTRMRWISLQPQMRGEFEPQPYRQLAKVYRASGLEKEATAVLVAEQDQRYARYGWFGRLLGGFLRVTIGYGHRPLGAIGWSLAVILMGCAMVAIGARAGVMRQTWPDSPPVQAQESYEKLHPLLYSLDVFLPFVNLHQEHYWWPDAQRSGSIPLFGRELRVSGAFLRYYLWAQVIAGWLLSAIFVAGVTGLIRTD